MPAQAAAPTGRPVSALGDEASAHTLAVMVLAEMRRLAILPTPRHYDLWFSFRTGANPALARRLERMLEHGEALEAPVLSALHDEFIAPAAGAAHPPVEEGAEALGDIADHLSDQIAAGEDSLRTYGRALQAMSTRLAGDPTVGSLVEVLGTMAADTTRASERNRDLERQLATCVARIDKLKRSLSATRVEAATDALTGLMIGAPSRRGCGARCSRCAPGRQPRSRC